MLRTYTSYKNKLLHRYWEYQKENYPDWERFFAHPQGLYSRPPVFLRSESWRNVIFDPNVSKTDINDLLRLLPKSEMHKWFRSMNSSQALGLSIFGNLVMHDSISIISDLKDDQDKLLFKDFSIYSGNFHFEQKIEYLGEPKPTSVDGFIPGKKQIALEFKFIESEIGPCSRPRVSKRDPHYYKKNCDGNYKVQNKRKSRCSLTERGVQYWDFIPHLFDLDSENDHSPCPIASNYQLVRNILAAGVTPDGNASVNNGYVVLFYDERNPAFTNGGKALHSYNQTIHQLRDPGMLRKCSWQKIINLMRSKSILPWLTEELDKKYGF